MKKEFLLIMLCISIVSGCKQTPSSYVVKGTLPDSTFNGKTLYILRYDDRRHIDSTTITGNTFVFKGVADSADMCRIEIGRVNFANLILENGEIEVDFDTHLPSSTTPLNTEFNKMCKAGDELRESFLAKEKELKAQISDPQEFIRQKNEYAEEVYKKGIIDVYKSFFYANKNNEVGADALYSCSHHVTPEEMDELLAEAGEFILSREKIKYLIVKNGARKNTVAGKPFTDFTIEQEDGSTVSLSDYVGKGNYVLVDFWASWCTPCIQETPIIAEVYEKYKNQNFEVLGVAVWDKIEDTQQAIEKHHIKWPQILDAKTIPTDLYGIDGIPHIILFAPDGTIAARNLRGDGLKSKVAEVMQVQ